MGIFAGPEEVERRQKLKAMEDKRVAFAQQLAREGFAPEKMLFAQLENGGFAALCREGGKRCLIVSPGFGDGGDFAIERFDALTFTRQEVRVKSEGMAGVLGLGKKGEVGVEYIVTRADGSALKLPFVAGRNSWLEAPLAKNPLLKTQRRRGDANVVWDFRLVERRNLDYVLATVDAYLEG